MLQSIAILFLYLYSFFFLLLFIQFSCLVQRGNDALDLLIAEKLQSLSKTELLDCCHSVGDQLLYLWNTFLKFHRFASFTSKPDLMFLLLLPIVLAILRAV
jgi:hypothetical protein